MYIKCVFLVTTLALLISCKSDRPEEAGSPYVNSNERRVFIANEGNFMFGNASLSVYHLGSETISNSVYSYVNNQQLGDVLQSLTIKENEMFLVLNNSNSIVVVDVTTYEEKTKITGLTSPRYLEMGIGNQAYVSDLYANGIHVINTLSYEKEAFIPIPAWTEQMKRVGDKLFISTMESNKLYVVDVNSNTLTDSIEIGYGGNSMVLDRNEKLWVLCGGSTSSMTFGGLYCINTNSNEIEKKRLFQSGYGDKKGLQTNPTQDTLYYLNASVYREAITSDMQNARIPFISKFWNNEYSLGVDPLSGELYLGDALDYVQRGTIYRFENGTPVDTMKAGIIPGGFYFPNS